MILSNLIRRAGVCLFAVVANGTAATSPVIYHVIAYMSTFAQSQPAGMTEGSPGVFYSTAGTSVLSVTSKGAITVLDNLQTGYVIPSLVVSGANGRFYSSVIKGSNPNAVFSVTAAGDPTIYPNQAVVPEFSQNLPDGSLLAVGVNPSVVLSVAKSNLDGTVTVVYQFPSTDYPTNVILASDGNYYGVAYNKTSPGAFAFRVTPSGTMTQLVAFPYSLTGGYAFAPLVEADGNLYGAMYSGGANGTGFIYKLTLAGQYTLLYSFPSGHYSPTSLILGSDGNLYGATLGLPGTSELFRFTTAGQYTTLYTMGNPTLEGACTCHLTQGSDGVIYGSAQGDGIYLEGAYFALDLGLPKPKPTAPYFTPQSGPAGTRVRVWGNNLLSANASFNGAPGTDVVSSGPNYVWATVPEGASSGPITITTPGGTVTTTSSFTVE